MTVGSVVRQTVFFALVVSCMLSSLVILLVKQIDFVQHCAFRCHDEHVLMFAWAKPPNERQLDTPRVSRVCPDPCRAAAEAWQRSRERSTVQRKAARTHALLDEAEWVPPHEQMRQLHHRVVERDDGLLQLLVLDRPGESAHGGSGDRNIRTRTLRRLRVP
jgi:hypothetical protein